MNLDTIKSEKIHLTLTLGEVDALIGRILGTDYLGIAYSQKDLDTALQKLDEAVNI